MTAESAPVSDLTLHLHAPTLEELFVESARRMVALAGAEAKAGVTLHRTVDVRSEDPPSLLLAWLRELLQYTDNEDRVFTEFTIELLTPQRVLAQVRGGLKHHVARRLTLQLGLEIDIRHGPQGYETTIPFQAL